MTNDSYKDRTASNCISPATRPSPAPAMAPSTPGLPVEKKMGAASAWVESRSRASSGPTTTILTAGTSHLY